MTDGPKQEPAPDLQLERMKRQQVENEKAAAEQKRLAGLKGLIDWPSRQWGDR